MVNVENLYAGRIGGERFGKDTTIYKFAKIKNAKEEFKRNNKGVEILDFGVGEHDGVAPFEVREELKKEVDLPDNVGYADNGILPFQQAAAKYLNNHLGINLPTDESAKDYIIHGIGSKGILSLVPLAFVNPGEVVIMTTPGYPVLGTHAKYLGGEVENLLLKEENKFLPDMEFLKEQIPRIEENLGKIKMFCVNYPNNPTGADANMKFWDKCVRLANDHNFIIVQDAAYSDLRFKGKPNGILKAEGGIGCGLGIYSLSKMSNMIGYRLAFIAGNPDLISAYGNVKDNTDSGQSKFIQRAGIVALENPGFAKQITSKYKRRLEGIVKVLNKHGFNTKMPDGTFFLYTKAPTGTKEGKLFENAEEASQHMLLKGGISVVPWDDAGKYIRFSATFKGKNRYHLMGSKEDDEEVFKTLDERLGRLHLTFN